MATATIYATSGSGFWLRSYNTSDYTTGTIDLWSDPVASFYLGTITDAKLGWLTYQRFDAWDVSSLAGSTVSAANFVYYQLYGNSGAAGNYYALKYAWSSAATSQWRTPTQLQALTNYATATSYSSLSGGDVTMTGSASLRSDIAAGGTLKTVACGGPNYSNANPSTGGSVTIAGTGYATTTLRPRLVVTYTSGSTQSLTRTVTDSASFSDSVTRASAGSRPVSDSSTLSDSPTRSSRFTRTVTDSASFSEALAGKTVSARSVADQLSGSDVALGPRAVLRAFTDSVTVSDSVSRAWVSPRVVSDSVVFADTAGNASVRSAAAADTVTFADLWARSILHIRAATDSFNVSDSVARRVGEPRAAADLMGVVDLMAVRVAVSDAVSDAVRMTDAATWVSPQVFTVAVTNSYLVAQRSLKAAAQRVRANVEANMTSTVRITRQDDGVLGSDGQLTVMPEATIFDGPAKLTNAQGPVTFTVGEEVQFFSSAWATIPMDWNGDPYYPQVNDLLTVTGADDPNMVGRRFRVVDVESMGLLATHRRLQLVGVQRYPGWTESRPIHRSPVSATSIPPDWLT